MVNKPYLPLGNVWKIEIINKYQSLMNNMVKGNAGALRMEPCGKCRLKVNEVRWTHKLNRHC